MKLSFNNRVRIIGRVLGESKAVEYVITYKEAKKLNSDRSTLKLWGLYI